METLKRSERKDLDRLKSFINLGPREENAIIISLIEVRMCKGTKEEPSPIGIRFDLSRPFNYKSFKDVLDMLGIGISNPKIKEDKTIVFQPKPYSEDFTKKDVKKQLGELKGSLGDEIDKFPQEIKDFLGYQF